MMSRFCFRCPVYIKFLKALWRRWPFDQDPRFPRATSHATIPCQKQVIDLKVLEIFIRMEPNTKPPLALWKSSLTSVDLPSKIRELLSFQIVQRMAVGFVLQAVLLLLLTPDMVHEPNNTWQQFAPTHATSMRLRKLVHNFQATGQVTKRWSTVSYADSHRRQLCSSSFVNMLLLLRSILVRILPFFTHHMKVLTLVGTQD